MSALAIIAVFVLCHMWSGVLRRVNYQVFDMNTVLSWRREGPALLKTSAYLDREVVLPSEDEWQDFELSFYILQLHQAGIITRYDNSGDEETFEGFFFDADKDRAAYFKKKDGEYHWDRAIRAPLDDRMVCRLKVKDGLAQLVINENSTVEISLEEGADKPVRFGFFLEQVSLPPTVFAKVKVSGHLASGEYISAQVQDPKGFSGLGVWLSSFMALFSFGAIAYFLARVFKEDTSERFSEIFAKGWWHVLPWGAPLAFAVIIFWPFLTQGEVLVSSYDNIGEILPLFFYSKHVFLEWVSGISRGLWNPIAHNGMPFFTNHWNMAFYPLHWPIFFAPDTQVMFWLTFKAFAETFFIGWLAYGFFYRELRSRGWALFCALIYQGGSFLIFSFTIFPTTSLFFMMTLYVYLLWSYHERSRLWNYIFLTTVVYCVMVSANVAFVFYAVLTLAILTLYRFFSDGDIKESLRIYGAAGAAIVTGGIISMIRMLPCLWGVAHSNRLVADYFSIHDRVPLFLRMFIPDIAGGLGHRNVNVFAQESLGWVFDNINPQSGFLIYYSIFAAVLMIIGFLTRMKGKDVFWKGYAAVVLAMALLWQPVWGVISIVFFPMNHFIYHLIALPIPLCMFAGKVGLRLSEQGVDKKVFARCAWAMLAIFVYFLIFETYLFPVFTLASRIILLGIIFLTGILWLLFLQKRHLFEKIVFIMMCLCQAVLWGVVFFAGVLTTLRPFPFKTSLGIGVLWPMSCILVLAGSAFWLWGLLKKNEGKQAAVCLFLSVVSVAVILIFVNRLALTIFDLGEPLGIYSADVLFGFIKWAAITQLILCVFWFSLRGCLRISTGLIFLGMIAFLDVVGFNLRYDNIAAPFFYQKAFYLDSFEYQDVPEETKKDIDLVNFRIGHQERISMNANKNAVFDIPSYSGIVGYMPERFAEFFSAFGMPKETILIYPVDAIENERFLDLSAVRYIFNQDMTVSQRQTAFSRMMLFFDDEVIEDKTARLARLKDPQWDYQRRVILSRMPEGGESFKNSAAVPIRLTIEKNNRDRVEAKYTTEKPGILLFNESFDSGWQAYVDEKRVAIVPANHNFMACFVPKGEHYITFLYNPKLFYISKWISILGGCFFVVCIVFLCVKKPEKAGIS